MQDVQKTEEHPWVPNQTYKAWIPKLFQFKSVPVCLVRSWYACTMTPVCSGCQTFARMSQTDDTDDKSGSYDQDTLGVNTLGARLDINVKVEYPKPKRIVFLPSAVLVQLWSLLVFENLHFFTLSTGDRLRTL